MTTNMICIAAFGVGLKCPRKIHLNTQCPPPNYCLYKKENKQMNMQYISSLPLPTPFFSDLPPYLLIGRLLASLGASGPIHAMGPKKF